MGLVFDIAHCSMNDGPGIRTVIFLKGCPLRCKWCHNPESQSFRPELYFISFKCTSCGKCVSACPNGCHSVGEEHTIDRKNCTLCGKCVIACPNEALEIKGKDMTAAEVIKEAEIDRIYYENSGGGITLSGGEPLAQPEFTYEILLLAKQRGLHTAVETSGFANPGVIKKVLPYIDFFLYDYKGTDECLHMQHTGTSNELILKNLELIDRLGGKVILRCPLIPGVNDDEGHLKGIADLSNKYACIDHVEVMAYHNMGVHKAARVGKEPELVHLTNTDEDTKDRWLDILKGLGAKGAIIG